MDIAFYIAELLKQHNEVNVPGLGTFFKSRIAGFYNQEKDTFYPPSQRLAFKESLDNTVILEEYISLKKNISAASSNYFITKFVSNLNNLLGTSQPAQLKLLGTLQKKDDSYQFEPAEDLDTEHSFYGLNPVKEQRTEPVKIEKRIIYPADHVKASGDARIIPVKVEAKSNKSSGIGLKSKIAIIFAGIIVIAVITVYFFYPQIFNIVLNPETTNRRKQPAIVPGKEEQPKSLTDSMTKADTIYNALKKQGFEVEKTRDTVEVSTKKELLNNTAESMFEIIGAAFNTRKDADSYIKSMKLKGLEAKTVDGMPGPKIKVSLGTFNDEDSANKELVRIKKDINKDAWIARVKPKKTN
jgi:CCDC81-like prokaryotic HU domain 1/SPOR domain